MSSKAIIICSGEIKDYLFIESYINKDCFIICADGGARHLKRLGITPNIILGDFDSIERETLEKYANDKTIEIIKYPKEKDMTDSEIALDCAINKGFLDIVLLGATGSRYDHSLANIFLLRKYIDCNARLRIINENNIVNITNNKIVLDKKIGFKVSIIPLTGNILVTTKGLKYKLNKDRLFFGSSIGVSNEYESMKAEILILEGVALVIESRD